MPELKYLTSPDTLIVLTFAKAGLGHLRVAFALMGGLPRGTNAVLFSSRDELTVGLHRISSTNPVIREVAEAFQRGILEDVFTTVYTRVLRRRAKDILPQVEAIIGAQKGIKKVIFVSTHFGLAHQISLLKERLPLRSSGSPERRMEARLVVVVTDDSPQHAWYVPQADLVIVPSEVTKRELLRYGKHFEARPRIEVVDYPLSLELGHELKRSKFKYKLKQADPKSRTKVKVSLPVSGAAVGLGFYAQLAVSLHELEPRFGFYITSRDSAYTKPFLDQMRKAEYSKVYSYKYDREVVTNYNKMIQKNTIAYEVTKPSEQTFKALYSPRQRGGVIMLFASPVGRQEYDNLWYLARNGLIPGKEDQEMLWRLSVSGGHITKSLLKKARNWRGVRLLSSPQKSAQFVYWLMQEGVFLEMMKFSGEKRSSGVLALWKLVDSLG